MRSREIRGEVFHERFSPVTHGFRYGARYLQVALDELPKLDSELSGFGYNRISLVSIWDKDYLGNEEGSVFDKLKRKVEAKFPDITVARGTLVTAPRYLGYVFNPVSFFWCYDERGTFVAFVADVNNTYGDGHTYFCRPRHSDKKGFEFTDRQKKTFHVSPFFDRSGDYEFYFEDIERAFAVRISIMRGSHRDFVGETIGVARPLHPFGLGSAFVQQIGLGVMTMPRILWQAARLRYQRRLQVYARPIPDVPNTHTVRGPTMLETLCMKLVFRALKNIEGGAVQIQLPDGSQRQFGLKREGIDPTILIIRHYRFFTRIVLGSEIAAGESFVDGEWETPDLAALLSLFAQNKNQFTFRKKWFSSLYRMYDRISHARKENSKKGSKRNIAAHYDLSNEMFSVFLDETMTYSCGIFESDNSSLQDAQEKKLSEILRLSGVQTGDHILEIGCGWGSFAIKAARDYGCHVTCLTLSEQQKALAEERIRKAGLEDLISIRLEDYRDTTGQFDKIVSIEMIEAVGEEYLSEYFRACERLLKPGGRAVIQAITLREERMSLYRKGCDWIQKHIFPGCFVPSHELLLQKVRESTALQWTYEQAIGPHYAKTLALWAQRFFSNRSAIESLGFSQEFIRKWLYYFGYCEAGFATGELNTYQIVLEK